jgi:hypothetical protein
MTPTTSDSLATKNGAPPIPSGAEIVTTNGREIAGKPRAGGRIGKEMDLAEK